MANIETSQIGQTVFGEASFLEATEYTLTPPTPADIEGLYRTQYGWGYLSLRQFCRSYSWSRPIRRTSTGFANLTISSVSGALVGKIRTDIQYSLVNSLEFTLDENGCADFNLVLSKLPSFEILPFSIVSVAVDDVQVYKGLITYPETDGTNRDNYSFKGFGLRRYLETLNADTDYSATTDITSIVSDIVQNWIAPYCPIGYNASKIDTSSGVVIANDIELGKFSIRQVLDILATMTITNDYYYIWGVDGDGDFYWTRKTLGDIEKTFFIGYNLNDFKPTINYEEVKNSIILQRQEGRASGGVGWSVAGVYNNESSIKKYGQNELIKQIPGYWSNTDADTVGNAILNDKKDPKPSARIDNYIINTGTDILSNGDYRFIMPKGDFLETLNDLDDYTAFSITGAGDLVLSNDNTFFVYADGCIKFNFQNAINQISQIDVEGIGHIKEIRFYVRASVAGAFLQIGVGETLWNENTINIDITAPDIFIPISWDLEALGVRKINKFGVKILENMAVNTSFWLDKLDVLYSGHKTYNMRLKRMTYKFNPFSNFAGGEFGTIPQTLSQYIAGLQAQSNELKFIGEIRS